MNYTAHITIMPHKELLDPQGKAVTGALHNLGFAQVQDVRVGKHVMVQIQAASTEEAQKLAEESCRKLLANAVMETYHVKLFENN